MAKKLSTLKLQGETVMNRLIEIQSKLKAPKNQRNNFGNYNYRSCEDILEAVKPLLKDVKLSLIISDEIINVGERFYVKATARLFDDMGKEIASVSAVAREEESKKGMDASQLTGSTSSYARKYALNGLFAIDDTKDADATNTHEKKTSTKSKDNPDTDLLLGLEATATSDEALRYYRANSENAKDADAFKQAYMKHYSKLKRKEDK